MAGKTLGGLAPMEGQRTLLVELPHSPMQGARRELDTYTFRALSFPSHCALMVWSIHAASASMPCLLLLLCFTHRFLRTLGLVSGSKIQPSGHPVTMIIMILMVTSNYAISYYCKSFLSAN